MDTIDTPYIPKTVRLTADLLSLAEARRQQLELQIRPTGATLEVSLAEAVGDLMRQGARVVGL